MEWLTTLIDSPTVQGVSGGIVVMILFQLGMALFRWQTEVASAEQGKAKADEAEAAADSQQIQATIQLATAINTMSIAGQGTAEAIQRASETSLAATEAIRLIGESIAQLVKEAKTFQAGVITHHQQHSESFTVLQATLTEVALETTSGEMNGKLDRLLAEVYRIGEYIKSLRDEFDTVNKKAETLVGTTSELVKRLDNTEQELSAVKEGLVTIKAHEHPAPLSDSPDDDDDEAPPLADPVPAGA